MTESATTFTTEDFFNLLSRSGLLGDTTLEAQKIRFQQEDLTPKAILNKMLSEHLLTPFQAKQLGERRHRGFFLSEKYKILDFLGQGGMSRVLLCEHLLLQRLVAVKILNKSLDKFPGAAERFLREARAAASMDHPNIARIFDVDRTGLGPCIVMEYVDGTNLHELAVKHNLLAVDRVVQYVSQAALGLQQAHQAGLVHRDIKPANLMLDRAGNIKLLDLGLARFFDPARSDNLTQQIDASCIIGTADYIAPEQVMDSSSADIRADIYSLGYTMYFLLTRKLPAGDGPVMKKLLWHQTKNAEPIRNHRPEIPEAVAAIIERMTHKIPAERFQTPLDVVEALAPWAPKSVARPLDEEMPKIKGSDFRLGLCPPPDHSKFVTSLAPNAPSSKSTTAPAASKSSPPASGSGSGNTASSSVDHSAGSASTIGYATPLGSAAIVPTGSTIHSARTNEVMSSSTETVATSGSSYIRGLAAAASSHIHIGFVRRHLKTLVLLGFAFTIGGLFMQWWLSGRTASNSVAVDNRTTIPTADANSALDPSAQPTKASVGKVPAVGVFLRGGGSTFIRPAMEQWTNLYETQYGVKIDYYAVGSSKGVEGLISNFVDFGCTDSVVSDEQIVEAGSQIVHVPIAMGAVVPTYNLLSDDDQPIVIRFTGAVLADIFLGRIKSWNDRAIAISNPGLTLPDREIIVVYRKDGSGSTAIWTDYLSKASSSWKKQIGGGSRVKWPIGVGAEKNDGVADAVSRTPGAIGYVELSYAVANHLSVGQVKNQAGIFVEPTVETISAAAASVRDVPDDLRFSMTDSPGANSYPIIGTCWAVVRVDQSTDRVTEIVRFLRWVTTDGQSILPSLQYGPLPAEMTGRVATMLDRLSANK